MVSGHAQRAGENGASRKDVRHLRHGGGRRGGGPPAHERGARPSRPRRRWLGGARRGRRWLPAARDHRRRGRRAAARQRDGRRDRGVQRRDIQPRRAARRARVARAPLAAYLRTGYVPNPASAFAAIQKLPPGGRLVLEGESARADRYWEVAPFLAAPPLPLSLDEAAAELRAHLVRAVRAQLVSDVPLGVFLSGGLDSTAITAVTRSVGGELNTFALGFAECGFDERDHAALAARALGTRHRTLTITPSLFLEGVRDLAPLIDEPLADPAWVPTFLLSRFARTHVKTVLVGEGADELFAGYPTYLGGALAARYARLPAGVRRAVPAAAFRGGGGGPRPVHGRAARRPGGGAALSPLALRAHAREDGAGGRGRRRALRRLPALSGRRARGALRAPSRRRAAGRRRRRA